MPPKKGSSIESVIANIEKQMGNKGDPVIRRFGDLEKVTLPCISFGYKEVDEASYCGGVPRGKMIEIFGPESGGKSLLSLNLTACAQRDGLTCCWVDAEHSFDPIWAKKHGVDIENIYIINDSMSAEKTLDYVHELCKSKAFGLVVVDSTAALVPQKELDGSIADQDYALLARAMSKGCKQVMHACGVTNTTCVFINQIREKMGVVFGSNETTPGGRALKFYSHQRIRVTPGGKTRSKEDDKVIAQKSYVKFVKNKVARPFGECEINILFDENAFNPVVMLANMARKMKVIKVYKQQFRIDKEETGAYTILDLANYLIKENRVIEIIEKTAAAIEENPVDKDNKEIVLDEAILEMKEDFSKIVSPLSNAEVEVKKIDIDGAEEEENVEEAFKEIEE